VLYPSLSPAAAAGILFCNSIAESNPKGEGGERGGKVGAEKRCATRISREGDTETSREKGDEHSN